MTMASKTEQMLDIIRYTLASMERCPHGTWGAIFTCDLDALHRGLVDLGCMKLQRPTALRGPYTARAPFREQLIVDWDGCSTRALITPSGHRVLLVDAWSRPRLEGICISGAVAAYACNVPPSVLPRLRQRKAAYVGQNRWICIADNAELRTTEMVVHATRLDLIDALSWVRGWRKLTDFESKALAVATRSDDGRRPERSVKTRVRQLAVGSPITIQVNTALAPKKGAMMEAVEQAVRSYRQKPADILPITDFRTETSGLAELQRRIDRQILSSLCLSDEGPGPQPRAREPIAPWHPPTGATNGDLAASYTDKLTPEQLFDLPPGSIFLSVDEGYDPGERTFYVVSVAAYRVVSASHVDCCYPHDDPFEESEQVSSFAREARLGQLRLVHRAEAEPTQADLGPAPFTLAELRDSRAEASGRSARRVGWSAYED